jgi:sodium transport system permease protein
MKLLSFWRACAVVFKKEWCDALRDRRTLAVVLFSSVLLGPLVLMALSNLLASLESRAESREMWVRHLQHAPTLRNYLERQSIDLRDAPADYEAQLRSSQLQSPVLVVPADFEIALLRGELPLLEVVKDSANKPSQSGVGRWMRLIAGFNQERTTLNLALRGVPPQELRSTQVNERDLASRQSRAIELTGMLPFFVIMAVLYGALNAALDTTAGERERGSLEPLLTNPMQRSSLVVGKWGAVAALSILVAALSCLSFIPAQWLIRSDSLQALFQFGWPEVLWFMAVLIPFAAMLSAVLMAVALRCKSVKEAQANSTVVVMGVSLLPLVTLFSQEGQAPWHLWVPALAQHSLMTRVLKGEAITGSALLLQLGICALFTGLSFWAVVRLLQRAVQR